MKKPEPNKLIDIEDILEEFNMIYDQAFDDTMQIIGDKMAQLQDLSYSDLVKLSNAKKYGQDLNKINSALEDAAAKANTSLTQHIENLIDESQYIADEYNAFIGTATVKMKDNAALMKTLNAILKASQEQLNNISGTTVIKVVDASGTIVGFDDYYKQAINKAIVASKTGQKSTQAAIENTIRDIAKGGMRVEYESGQTRRIDSAIRQNIRDTSNQINQELRDEVGRQINYDGVQLSAHALCATDHVEYQGRQFTNEEFEKIQGSLPRPFGKYNCGHVIYRIRVGITSNPYSDEDLERYKSNSNKIINIDGKEKTRYEWTQEMRKIEADLRDMKHYHIGLKAAGLNDTARTVYRDINIKSQQYKYIANEAGIETALYRAKVSGYLNTAGTKK